MEQENALSVPPPAPAARVPPAATAIRMYWDMLSDIDRESYTRLWMTLSSSACKHRRHHSREINSQILGAIKSFILRNDGDDWKRGLVCGIWWIGDNIAINTRQLKLLISKCKSSVNALFQSLGYATVPSSNEFSTSLMCAFPCLKENFSELRQWTARVPNGRPVEAPPPDPEPEPEPEGASELPLGEEKKEELP